MEWPSAAACRQMRFGRPRSALMRLHGYEWSTCQNRPDGSQTAQLGRAARVSLPPRQGIITFQRFHARQGVLQSKWGLLRQRQAGNNLQLYSSTVLSDGPRRTCRRLECSTQLGTNRCARLRTRLIPARSGRGGPALAQSRVQTGWPAFYPRAAPTATAPALGPESCAAHARCARTTT